MVQSISTVARTAKVFGTGDKAYRFISQTFKDGKGATIVVTRKLDSKNNVVLTRMKKLFTTILKNGNKVLTRKVELHVQNNIPGTNLYWLGNNKKDKFFNEKNRVFDKNGKYLAGRELSYKKEEGSKLYTNIVKKLEKVGLYKSTTEYFSNSDVSKATRKARKYEGENILKLQHREVDYDTKGLPYQNNNFKLDEFEIF
jgi:hypothetical protein